MANERWLKLTLAVFGLVCSIITLYGLFSGSGISVSDSRSAVERFLRKERAADTDECLWVLIAQESVKTLKSPNYPDPYPSNAYCRWLLTTLQPNDTISLKIESLSIEPEQQCRLDSLRVFLGSSEEAPSLGPFCGNVNDLVLETNSSALLLVFRSDSEYEDNGFSVDYFVPTAKGCRELLTDPSGTLTSPGFPDNYPDETDCTTTIEVSEDKRIVLHFDSVDLEYGENCTFDYLQIYDGNDKNSVLLGQICRHSDGLSFESSSSSLSVHFHSDSTVNRRGYRARYSSVDRKSKLVGNCDWESDESNGTVTSPNYPQNYPSFANCSLWIVAPERSRILVTLDAVLLEMESNCSYDFLQISEGDQFRGRFCGRGTEPKSILSDGNEIQIQFQSDNFVEFLGFKLRYEFIKTVNTEKESDVEEEGPDSDESFTFRVKPENVTLATGSTHMMHCQTEYPNARIRWLKEEIFLAGDDPLPGLKLLDNGTLWIRNMRRHLAGKYTCVAVAPEEDDIAATGHVSMKDGPNDCEIGFRKTPSDSEFKEGDFAHLECLAEGGVSWEKDGRPLPPHFTVLKNGYVYVESVALEDEGLYTCVASDAASGCVQRASAFLNVSQRAEIQEICGRAKLESTRERAKIVGGYDAPKGAYPWQVMLWDERDHKSFCGATLLNERWIVTAAHCIFNKYNTTWHRIVVKLGKYDTQTVEEHEVRNSIADFSAILYHPEFHPGTFDNDLALVRLRHRVHFTDYILPVCLPHRNLSESLLNGPEESGPRMGTVVGWGKLKEGGPLPRFLQEIKVPIVDDEVCKKSTSFSVTRNMFCAGYSQEVIGDSCHGDSGGPLMMRHEKRWYILGIVSWGEGCGKTDKYGFYTRLSNHLSWIHGIIKS